MGVRQYFTPVTGNEVTTRVGHFNVFPTTNSGTVIDHGAASWKELSGHLGGARQQVVILNHGRDVHAGFRPFDQARHLAPAGMRLDGWAYPANAMEVFNSGSQQSDPLELTRDWLGLLNHGHVLTPAGCSDSHDVSRYIVGQARTYVRCDDDDPANIDIAEAVRNFTEGSVMVSFGLLASIAVDDTYGPGEMVPGGRPVRVYAKVSGPSWLTAEKVTLFANGKKIREEKISTPSSAGVKWSGTWDIALPSHDVHLAVLAEGPGIQKPFWPIAKPYQPVSPDWHPIVMGLSGAVWIDADGNGQRNSAHDYALRLVQKNNGNMLQLMKDLAAFDEAVSEQAAALLHARGADIRSAEMLRHLRTASPQTRSAFRTIAGHLPPRP